MLKLKPTEEQAAAIQVAKSGKTMSIRALAGTGKTTTLSMICQALYDKRIIYLAFNKAIVTDAEKMMPANTMVRTFHSVAYRAVRPSQDRLQRRANGQIVAKHFKLQPKIIGDYLFSETVIGTLVLEAVHKFCLSADPEITANHASIRGIRSYLTIPDKLTDSELAELQEEIVTHARAVWDEQTRRDSDFPITHDTYVKIWALNNPRIEQEVILFDEAQDASPVFIDIVHKQTHAQVIWVGDPYQQIYTWRGAVDAFNRIQVETNLYLTHSYRFGPNVAQVGSLVLNLFGQNKPITGAGGASKDGRTAILCRTNAGAINHYIRLIGQEKSVQLVGAGDMLTLLHDMKSLREGRPRGSFALFSSWDELVEYSKVKSNTVGDVAVLMKLASQHGLDFLIRKINLAKTEQAADITICTIHRSKGREWDYVHIADDWRDLHQENASPDDVFKLGDEELRLLYVGLTRARVKLDYRAVKPWLKALRLKFTPNLSLPNATGGLPEIPSCWLQPTIAQTTNPSTPHTAVVEDA